MHRQFSLSHLAHDSWAKIIDGVSFGIVNALQVRARSGSHGPEEMEEYVNRWQGVAIHDFYRIPENYQGAALPERGVFRCSSPLSSGTPENDHIHFEYWPGPRGHQSPVMFMLHGVMSVSDVGYRMWARTLNQLGWSAIFFHLPYHYGRRPAGAASGEMALTANLIRTSEGIRQAVIELRWIIAALRQRGAPHIGIWGTSYGGWIGSLLCVLEPAISTAWLLEPIVDVDWAIWESPAARTIQYQLRRRRIPRELVRRHMPLVCPTHHRPVVPTERILLVAGTFDRIAPPSSIRALQNSWTGARYAEFRQGHVGYQLMPESLRLARNAFPGLFST